MVRKRVGLQPERHDCHSGGQWQHFIPQLYLYGKLRRKIRHVTIHQDGKPADVITYGYIFTLGAVSGDDVVSTGGTVTYSVTSQKITYTNGSETSRSNIGWSASANVSWISAGTNSATVSENPTTSDRSGTITLTQNESGRKLSITVYQDRKVSVDIN